MRYGCVHAGGLRRLFLARLVCDVPRSQQRRGVGNRSRPARTLGREQALHSQPRRDAVTGKWIRARYVATRDEAVRRYPVFQIVGPPELRDVDENAGYFASHRARVPKRQAPPQRGLCWHDPIQLRANARRTGRPCRAPAMKNGRCRMHGGHAGRPAIHGRYTKAALASRREWRTILRRLRELIDSASAD
jgi:hypothetical protein